MLEIKNYIEQFKNWLKEDEKSKDWEGERLRRIQWYKEKLNFNNIDNLNVEDFSRLIKDLWASNVWKNKDYKVQYLIQNNGLEKIKKELKNLLYGEDSIEKRWDTFKKSIKGLGPSSISEILAFFNPKEYALINLKVYKVLPRLGIPVQAVKDGGSYKKTIEALKKIQTTLIENNIENIDFITTDFFIAFLFYDVFNLAYERGGKETPVIEIEEKISKKELGLEKLEINSHEVAEAVLLSLGNLLGYDTYTPDSGRVVNDQKLEAIATLQELPYFAPEKVMDSAQNIDVVWLKDEWPECFFEVEHTTGVTAGLLRIYQAAERLNAKFYIIGPKDVLKKFEREIEKAPFNKIKDKYRFRSYEELKEMYLTAKEFKEVSGKFL